MTKHSREVRQRILDVLKLIASPEAQLKYQASAPHVDVPAELFNQWDDWYSATDQGFCMDFTESELRTIKEFNETINAVSSDTPQQLPPLESFIQTSEWKRLHDGAKKALQALKEPS